MKLPDTRLSARHRYLLAGLALAASCLQTAAAAAEDAIPATEYSVIAPLASTALLVDAITVDGAMVSVGTRGIVLISEDQGASWKQVSVPTRSMLTGVYFHDRNLGWVVGHDAVILKTTDGGESWRRVNYDPDLEMPLFDVVFSDASHGMAMGAYGLVLVTDDGGETWTEQLMSITELGAADLSADEAEDEAEDEVVAEDGFDDGSSWEEDEAAADYHLNKIVAAADGRLYVAAEAGHVYRSDDGGNEWLRLPSDYIGSFFGAVALGRDDLLVFGLRGNMFRTRDGGASWEEVETPVEITLTEGMVMDDGTIVVVGMSGTVLVSTDGAQSFSLVQQADRKALMRVLPGGNGSVLLFGEAGAVQLAREDYLQ
jgi:photosystem II stability/assembly factor-like uncharacterized protein